MSPKVLFLVYDLDSASGICVQKVAAELKERNFDVFILTKSLSEQPYQTQYGATVYSVLPDMLELWREKLTRRGGAAAKMLNRLVTLAIRARVVLCYPVWPLNSLLFSRRFTSKAKQIAAKQQIDAVIPVYNTVDALIAADAIKQEMGQLKNIPYLLDAFYGGQTPKLMSEKKKRQKALRWEKKLFARADGIVMMQSAKSSYTQDGISPEYLERTVFLDIPMLTVSAGHMAFSRKNSADRVFLFAGSMPRNIRDPQALLDIFRSTAEPDWQLHLVGSSDFEDMIDTAAKKDHRIHPIGRIPYAQAQERMQSADYLVNIGNTLSHMVPSKIFEYMSYNKPIISTYKIPEDPCLPYLKLYHKALLLDESESPQKNAQLLRQFVMQVEKEEQGSADVFRLAKPGMPLYNNTPSAFADYLETQL